MSDKRLSEQVCGKCGEVIGDKHRCVAILLEALGPIGEMLRGKTSPAGAVIPIEPTLIRKIKEALGDE